MGKNISVRSLCVVLLLFAFLNSGEAAGLQYDVVVAGAGAGGITAAIQAARMGADVLVIEESPWIGGQMTAAGVTTMDDMSNQRSGIYREFIRSIEEF